MPTRLMIFGCILWMILSGGKLGSPLALRTTYAQENTSANYAESKDSVVNELRWITQKLRRYHLQIKPKLIFCDSKISIMTHARKY